MHAYRSTNPHPINLVGNHLGIYPKIFTEYLLILGTVLGTGSICSRLAMSCLRRAFFLVKVSLIKENDFSCSALPEYAGRILKLVFQNQPSEANKIPEMLLPINTVSIIFSARHNENILRCIRLSNMEIIPIKKCSKVRAFEGILMLFLSRVHVAIYVRILSFLPSFSQQTAMSICCIQDSLVKGVKTKASSLIMKYLSSTKSSKLIHTNVTQMC